MEPTHVLLVQPSVLLRQPFEDRAVQQIVHKRLLTAQWRSAWYRQDKGSADRSQYSMSTWLSRDRAYGSDRQWSKYLSNWHNDPNVSAVGRKEGDCTDGADLVHSTSSVRLADVAELLHLSLDQREAEELVV